MPTVLLALILGLLNGVSQLTSLAGIGFRDPLLFGVITGVLVGDVNLGFEVGATMLLMSIGFYTYGGATIPDYITGAIFGVVAAQRTGDIGIGLSIATVLGLLMSQMDILRRTATTFFQHGGDRALANNNIASFERWHLAGTLPWSLANFIPTFIGLLFADSLEGIAAFAESAQWFSNGLLIVGRALPAVGFALLLSYMNLGKYWPYMVLGYIGYAYLGIGTIGLAFLGAALAGLHLLTKNTLKGANGNG